MSLAVTSNMIRLLARTFSISFAAVLAICAISYPLRADLMDGVPSVIKQIVPPNVVASGPYSLTQMDAFRPAVFMAGGNTLTFPAASDFLSGSKITICNSSANDATHHAILQPTAPSPSFVRLYMGQCETVLAVNGSWSVPSPQGKFIPAFTPTLFVDNAGSDNNDGLVSNAAANAIQNPNTCWTIFQREMNLSAGNQPVCSPTGGQTFTGGVSCNASTVITVYFLIGNGGNAILRNTAGNVVVQESDFCGYIIFDNITFDCTSAASHPCFGLFLHQQNGSDLSTSGFTNGNTFIGVNSGDVGIWCDSRCKINTGALVTMTGTFNFPILLDATSVMVINNGLTVSNSATTQSLFKATQLSNITFSGTLTLGTSASVSETVTLRTGSIFCIGSLTNAGSGTSGRKFSVLDNSVLKNPSANALAGSTSGIVTASGYAAGFAPDNAAGNTGVNAAASCT